MQVALDKYKYPMAPSYTRAGSVCLAQQRIHSLEQQCSVQWYNTPLQTHSHVHLTILKVVFTSFWSTAHFKSGGLFFFFFNSEQRQKGYYIICLIDIRYGRLASLISFDFMLMKIYKRIMFLFLRNMLDLFHSWWWHQTQMWLTQCDLVIYCDISMHFIEYRFIAKGLLYRRVYSLWVQ